MKLQVLIADADPDFQRTMTQALSREGDMEAAGVSSDGLETLSLIQTSRPEVVLLDLIQQRLDGLAILRRLAGREDAPPVLVLTGFVNAAVVAECAKLGAAYFIPKPCDTAALMQCLRQCAKAGGKSPAAVAAPAPVPAHLESAVTGVFASMLTRAALRFFFTSSAPVLSKYGAIPPCSAAKSFSAFHWLDPFATRYRAAAVTAS